MKEIKVGMRVYLRDDLQVDYYGNFLWSEQAGMLKGQWVTINSIHPRYNYFTIEDCHNQLPYDVEMIDWDKTLNKSKQQDIQEGMCVYLKDDLQEGISYSPKGNQWYPSMKRGEWVTITKLTNQNGFNVANSGMWVYSPEMIDWDKTEEYYMVEPNPNPMFDIKWCDIIKMKEQETMNKLEVGMWVYLRDDLQANERYGDIYFSQSMYKGMWVQVIELSDDDSFHVNSNVPFYYSPEMIDWEKTNLGQENMAGQFGMKQESEASKSKIKFKLYNEGNVVIFRVLEQSKDITLPSYEDETYLYQASNGFKICSYRSPLLHEGEVYIRGYNEDEGDETDTLPFQSEQEALEYIDRVLFAFKEWSNRGYPFGDVVVDSEVVRSDSDIYKF